MSLLLLLVGAPSRAVPDAASPSRAGTIPAFDPIHQQLGQQAIARRRRDERDEESLVIAILRSRLRI